MIFDILVLMLSIFIFFSALIFVFFIHLQINFLILWFVYIDNLRMNLPYDLNFIERFLVLPYFLFIIIMRMFLYFLLSFIILSIITFFLFILLIWAILRNLNFHSLYLNFLLWFRNLRRKRCDSLITWEVYATIWFFFELFFFLKILLSFDMLF